MNQYIFFWVRKVYQRKKTNLDLDIIPQTFFIIRKFRKYTLPWIEQRLPFNKLQSEN